MYTCLFVVQLSFLFMKRFQSLERYLCGNLSEQLTIYWDNYTDSIPTSPICNNEVTSTTLKTFCSLNEQKYLFPARQ